ncbi:MAG: HDOD domain-containing protein [Methyloprofundus sp.]|nr:HDOD domain-containing protein [Methyloprofundus sp.]
MSQVSEQEILDYVEKMPAFPKSVSKIIELTSSMDSSAKDIITVIEGDPVMTGKILQVMNSAFYSLPTKITSIHRALVIIGLNTIKNLAISVAVIGVLKPYKEAHFDSDSFLEHSFATAVICKMLAERQGVSLLKSSDYFIAGLLHDFGKIVFAELKEDEFKLALDESSDNNTSLHLAELKHLGMDHSQVSQILAIKWGLSENVAEAIKDHHQSRPDDLLSSCIFVANQIAKQGQIGNSGNPVIELMSEEQSAVFGGSFNELVEELGDLSLVNDTVQQFIGT